MQQNSSIIHDFLSEYPVESYCPVAGEEVLIPKDPYMNYRATINKTLVLYRSITCMQKYLNTSFEELRLQDYEAGRKRRAVDFEGFKSNSEFFKNAFLKIQEEKNDIFKPIEDLMFNYPTSNKKETEDTETHELEKETPIVDAKELVKERADKMDERDGISEHTQSRKREKIDVKNISDGSRNLIHVDVNETGVKIRLSERDGKKRVGLSETDVKTYRSERDGKYVCNYGFSVGFAMGLVIGIIFYQIIYYRITLYINVF